MSCSCKLPFPISLGDKNYNSRADFDNEQFFALMAQHLPKRRKLKEEKSGRKWIYCKRYRKDIQWQRLNELLRECNEESELHVRIRYDNPDWFKKGAEAALLAPTAINQQKFKMEIK